jgi:hypothetical protein
MFEAKGYSHGRHGEACAEHMGHPAEIPHLGFPNRGFPQGSLTNRLVDTSDTATTSMPKSGMADEEQN